MTSFSVKFNGEVGGGGWRPHTSVDCPLVPSKLFSHTVCGLKYILYSVQYSIEVIFSPSGGHFFRYSLITTLVFNENEPEL